MNSKFNKCPDFDLADLTDLPKELFIHGSHKETNNLKSSTLTLAVIFNEYKTLCWAKHQLLKGKPPKFEITPYCGQFSGMEWHLTKMFLSHFFEISRVMGQHYQFLHKEVIKEEIEKKMNPASKKKWEELKKISYPKKKRGQATKKILSIWQNIRNQIGYHFNSDDNYSYKGYQEWMNLSSSTDKLYMSLGDTLESTRFYFGDIVVEGLVKKRIKEAGLDPNTLEDVFSFTKPLNEGLRYFIEYSVDYLQRSENNKDP